MKNLLLQTSLLFGIVVSSNALADDDLEQVRELVKSGEIIPLEQLLKKVADEKQDKLRLLDVELEREKGRLVYELELVDEQGVVRELLFDAKTGAALGEEEED
ncbi:MAG: PepSY domain-containing protein [Gammaproteobacteria bacterium]|nr:PepSY domain-containing protein [Gammaproteobacteria bacterium]MCW8922805.1 PepSY domain-containing protein [Gammaproteobacteria bacterium]